MAGNVVIVGAGISGLVLGSELAAQGIPVTLIERESRIGGLARSFKYSNGAIFDIGPHRFHTDDPKVQSYIEDVLADNVISIGRDSQLYLFGKYLPWPITLKNVLALPPSMLIKSGFDLILPKKKSKSESFEDYIIEKYGKTLYDAFFKSYTEKFLDYSCSNLHRDWAQAGINRATIDKQVKTDSLGNLIKSVLFSKNPDTKFLYPKEGGTGSFCEVLADRIRKHNGTILSSTTVEGITTEDGKVMQVVTSSGEEIQADYVFWSGSLGDLRTIGHAPPSVPELHYISTVLFNYVVSEYAPQGFQWCYFGDKDMEVDRISLPRTFNPGTVPEGKEALCIEVTAEENSKAWVDPSRFDCIIETFMLHAKLIKSLDSIEDLHIEKVQQTYPLYVLNYPRKLKANMDWVDNNWSNLALLGRTGRFWYNNMDHSIAASLSVSERFGADYKNGKLRAGSEYGEEERQLGEND
ncbi:hypothetical protein BVX94_03680 [bacterium B17]|nr:hypothetical protein BVX94_03680 [bacterium B17]